METSDWLSLLAVAISLYAIYLGKLSEKRAKKLHRAQRKGELMLTLINSQLKIENQLLRYKDKLAELSDNGRETASLGRVIDRASTLVETIREMVEKMSRADVIDEVALEEVLSLAKIAERHTEHVESSPL